MSIDWNSVFWFVVRLLGFLLAVALTVGVIYWLRQRLISFLTELIPNEKLVSTGTTFVMLLLGLQGAGWALNYINQAQLNTLLNGLVSLSQGLAGVIQWAVYIAALFFIAYAIKGHSSQGNTPSA